MPWNQFVLRGVFKKNGRALMGFDRKAKEASVNRQSKEQQSILGFDNLPKLLTTKVVSSLFGYSINTIYDWKYRPKKYHIPRGLFLKVNQKLFIRSDILQEWIASQNLVG